MLVQHPEYLHQLELDDASGLPTAFILRGEHRLVVTQATLSLNMGGDEVRSATGGTDYQGATQWSGTVIGGPARWTSGTEGDAYCQPVTLARPDEGEEA